MGDIKRFSNITVRVGVNIDELGIVNAMFKASYVNYKYMNPQIIYQLRAFNRGLS